MTYGRRMEFLTVIGDLGFDATLARAVPPAVKCSWLGTTQSYVPCWRRRRTRSVQHYEPFS